MENHYQDYTSMPSYIAPNFFDGCTSSTNKLERLVAFGMKMGMRLPSETTCAVLMVACIPDEVSGMDARTAKATYDLVKKKVLEMCQTERHQSGAAV